MPSYHAPIKDMQFVINYLWTMTDSLQSIERFADFSDDLADAMLEESAKINQTLLHPLNQSGDTEGCQFAEGKVTTPAGFVAAYETFRAAGWTSVSGAPEFGGQGAPAMLNVLLQEMQCSSNVSFSLYPGLTEGVCHALEAHASDDLKQKYIPKMVAGDWTGVMCLTESHAGSDLGLLRTKAELQTDGSYQLNGTKIFITGGDHDLTDNIVHLVLARTPDAPAGVKGISLFLVSKYHVDDAGALGEKNDVSCSAIEHKMGLKGSATCVMNYDNATGYLVGELNQGLRAMFTVMNAERLAIGLQGLGLGEIAYQNAKHYALDRLQGRAATGAKYPEKAADPIIVHPDVRRMLLTMRAFNEGCRALAVWVGRLIDLSEHGAPDNRQKADRLLAVFTPVVKAFFTDQGFESCNLGVQVFGGHGYISEWGIEQFVRDARIAQLYEGTNGIQSLDLVKRRLIADKGEAIGWFIAEAREFATTLSSDLTELSQPLNNALDELAAINEWIITVAEKDPNEIGACSQRYCRLLALTALAYMWVKMAAVANSGVFADSAFNDSKIKVARFYLTVLLPEVSSLATAIRAGASAVMDLADQDF